MFLDKMLSVFRGFNSFSLLALNSSNIINEGKGIGDLSRVGGNPREERGGRR